MKDAICLITYRPHLVWLDFLNNFKFFKIYIVVDDSSYDLMYLKLNYPKITFIQIDNKICESAGYINVNYMLQKKVSGWDKAIYYFVNNPNRVWFIEDDVYFSNEKVLKKINDEYPSDDLVSSIVYPRENNWSWNNFSMHQIKEPWFHGMMCICRVSPKLLKSIEKYVKKEHTLVFLEAFFPTLCFQSGLLQSSPLELNTILYLDDKDKKINPKLIYHPMKDISFHKKLRDLKNGGRFSLYSIEMPLKKSKGKSRKYKQRGGDSASYGFGQAITPGAPYAPEVIAKEACLAATRPGTLVNYSAGTGGLPGFAGGSRKKRSSFSFKNLLKKARAYFKGRGRRQRGGRWSANVGATTSGPNPFVPISRIGPEGGLVNTAPGGAASPLMSFKQLGGVGGIDSAYYAAPTAGYTNMASKWVGTTGTPSMLQVPYEAKTMNPACLKTGGSRSKTRKGKRGVKR